MSPLPSLGWWPRRGWGAGRCGLITLIFLNSRNDGKKKRGRKVDRCVITFCFGLVGLSSVHRWGCKGLLKGNNLSLIVSFFSLLYSFFFSLSTYYRFFPFLLLYFFFSVTPSTFYPSFIFHLFFL